MPFAAGSLLFLLLVIINTGNCADELPDISSEGRCKAEIAAHCHGIQATRISNKAAGSRDAAKAGDATDITMKPRAHMRPGDADPEQRSDMQQIDGKSSDQAQEQQQEAGEPAGDTQAAAESDAAAGAKRQLLAKPLKPRVAQPVNATALKVLKSRLKLPYSVTDPKRLAEGSKNANCLKRLLVKGSGEDMFSHGCTEEIVSFYSEIAADSANDFQLMAVCAEDILIHCPDTPSTATFSCLVANKHAVNSFCSAALASRITSTSGLYKWDQGMARSCSDDVGKLCAAELDSDAHMPGIRGFATGCLRQKLLDEVDALVRSGTTWQSWRAGRTQASLTADCAQAIFRREMAEAEDVRYSPDLPSSCGQEMAMLCSKVNPGKGETMMCLEKELEEYSVGEDCTNVIMAVQILRAADARLDWRLRQFCREDVVRLCQAPEYVGQLDPKLMLDDWNAPPAAGINVTICLRRKWDLIKFHSCKRHVRRVATAALRNTILDGPLLAACATNISNGCVDASAALGCLKGLVANGLTLAPACAGVVHERLLEAADDFDLLPEVGSTCKRERMLFCEGVPSAHGAVLDCLADFQSDNRFDDECRMALTGQFMLAVSDIRMLSLVEKGCESDRAKLCPDVKPGSGRVIDCLQHHSTEVASPSCKRQLMKLQGFAAHDYRLDYSLRQACAVDVSKHCSHVVPGSGRVHACLREHEKKLDDKCRQKVESAEAREHLDVSLNPTIRNACQSSITSLCGKFSGSINELIPCLKTHMVGPTFPSDCKEALTNALERKARKYVLQPALQNACNADVAKLCPDISKAKAAEPAESDKTGTARQARRALHAADDASKAAATAVDPGSQELVCLAEHVSQLSEGCKEELAEEVHRELVMYVPGMPLIAACDGDAKQLCNIGSDDISMMTQTSLLGCLAGASDKLSPGCWSLISLFDKQQLQYAKQVAAGIGEVAVPVSKEQQEVQRMEVEKAVMEKVSQHVTHQVESQLAAQLQQQLQSQFSSRFNDTITTELEHYVARVVKGAQSTAFLWGVMASTLLITVAAVAWAVVKSRQSSRRVTRAPGGQLVVKDGNV